MKKSKKYSKKQLRKITKLTDSQINYIIKNLAIKTKKHDTYYSEHLQLILEYKPKKRIYLMTLESRLNLKDYE